MDAFVCTKLHEWGLEQWIETFIEKEIDKHRLFCLEGHEIDNLITKTGPRAKLKKHLTEWKSQQMCDNEGSYKMSEEPPSVEVSSSYWSTGKDFYDAENVTLENVKKIMTSVEAKQRDDTELGHFLRNYIANMKIEKRDLVGVFGQTGAGKSSLINAVVGEKDLLPTGSLAACTTVMIKVEGNPQRQYEAEIEFITEMEWEDELWSAKNLFLGTPNDKNNDEDDDDEDEEEGNDLTEKLTAFYGDVWKNKSVENLMNRKYFREIPEFFLSAKKKILCKTAKTLVEKIARFTRNDLNEEKSFWPLVKCVTMRVPNRDLPKHITIVDLPGKGDRNKSRDEMWKKVIESCSTVWIVTNMNRAVADRDAWDILRRACDLVENHGICQNIHFICTKTDVDADERPASDVRQYILERNVSAKASVGKEMKKLAILKKHLTVDCFDVFTVSSWEFLNPKYLQQNETEIPKLREFLQNLNELHGQTFSYVRGAFQILSMMKEAQGMHLGEQRSRLCAEIKEKLKVKLIKVQTSMCRACTTLDKCLTKGVEKSLCFCQGRMQKIMHNESGSAFHSTLKCVVENNGIHTSKNGVVINLNTTLSSFLTQSINKDFRMIFPNDGKSGPFYGAIQDFSLDTMLLTQKYKALELLLIFLRTEEEKLKMRLIKIIRNRKKVIYNSLTQTVGENMQECYKQAARFVGKGSLDKMRQSIENYIQDAKDDIFGRAKEEMLNQLKLLKEDIVSILRENLQKSVELVLKKDDKSIPDIMSEFKEVMKHYNELMSTEGDADLLLSDSEMDVY